MPKSRVVIALDPDRASGTSRAVGTLGMPDLRGKTVLVKPNFNTADPAPGSTHIDTLRTMIQLIKEQAPKKIVVGDRSGPEKTSKVFQEKGVFALAGLTLTFAWFGLFIRSWNWMDHWFKRAQAIHFKRYGEPKDSEVVPPFTVFPRKNLFPERGFVQGGLSVKTGGYVMLGVFMSIWAILVLVSVASLLEQM